MYVKRLLLASFVISTLTACLQEAEVQTSDVSGVLTGPTFPGDKTEEIYSIFNSITPVVAAGACPLFSTEIEMSLDDGATWMTPSGGGSDYTCDANGFSINFPAVLPSTDWNSYFSSYTPPEEKTFLIRAKSVYYGASSSSKIIVKVPAGNTAPTLAAISNASTDEDQSKDISLVPADIDGPLSCSLTHFSLVSSTNLTLVPITAVSFGGVWPNCTATIAPAANMYGSTDLTIKLDDGQANVTQTFTLTVNAVDDAPVLTSIAALGSATEDTAYPIPYATLDSAAVVSDIEVDPICYKLVSIDSGTLKRNGAAAAVNDVVCAGDNFEWKTAANASGANIGAFTVKAFANSLESASAVQVKINVSPVDDPPTLTNITNFSGAIEDQQFVISYSNMTTAADENDIDGDAICFRVETVISGTLNLNGVPAVPGSSKLCTGDNFEWQPAADANGAAKDAFTVVALANGATSGAAVTVRVDVAAVDDPPTLTTISDLGPVSEDASYSITYWNLSSAANEADIDSTPICFRVESVSSGTLTKAGVPVTPGTTILCSGETWDWQPTANANGTLPAFTVKAYAAGVTSTSAIQVNVNVTAVDDPPVLAAIGDITIEEGQVLTGIDANDGGDDFDADLQAITYGCWFDITVDAGVIESTATECNAANLPGVSFNTASGALSWTPSFTQSGVYEFKIKGTAGGSQDRIFKVTVNDVTPFRWIGAEDTSWTNPGNWTSYPGPGDVAVFDGACGPFCNVNVDGAVSVAGINMQASYTGQITQDAGQAITIGATGLTQAGGTLTGAATGTIIINGPINVTGGTFNCGQNINFSGNSLIVASAANWNCAGANIFKVMSNPALAIEMTNAPLISTLQLANTTPLALNITGTLAVTNLNNASTASVNINTGTILINKDISSTNNFIGGSGKLKFSCADGSGTLNGGTGGLPDVEIACGANVLNLIGSISLVNDFMLTSGSVNHGTSVLNINNTSPINIFIDGTSSLNIYTANFNSTNTVTLGGSGTGEIIIYNSLNLQGANGALLGAKPIVLRGSAGLSGNAWAGGNGKIKIDGNGSQTISSSGAKFPSLELAGTGTISINNPLDIYGDFIVAAGPTVSYGAHLISLMGTASAQFKNANPNAVNNLKIYKIGTTLDLANLTARVNRLEYTSGTLTTGKLEVLNNIVLNGSPSGSTELKLSGPLTQELNFNGHTWGAGAVSVNKASASVLQQGIVQFAPTADLTIESPSVWDMNGHNLNVADVFNLNAGAKLIKGCGTLTPGSPNILGTVIEGKDNLQITVSSNSPVTEGDDAVFTATLSAQNCRDTVFNYSTVADSATSDVDYTSRVSVLVTIPQATGTASFTVPILSDQTYEGVTPEQLDITTTNLPAGIIFSPAGPYDVQINDGDSIPGYDFATPTSSTSEGASGHQIAVRLDKKSYQGIVINFSHASAPTADYTVTPTDNLLTITAGSTIAQIQLSNAQDVDVDNEAITFNSLNVSSGTASFKVGGNASHVVTINDDDGPHIWTGNGAPGAWNDITNWNKLTVPGPSNDVELDNSCSSNCNINIAVNASIKSLKVKSNYLGAFTIKSTKTLTIGVGGLEVQSGSTATVLGEANSGLTVAGNINIQGGSITLANTKVILNGLVDSTWDAFTELTILELEVDKISGADVVVNEDIHVTGMLTLGGDVSPHYLDGSNFINVDGNVRIGNWSGSAGNTAAINLQGTVLQSLGCDIIINCNYPRLVVNQTGGSVSLLEDIVMTDDFVINSSAAFYANAYKLSFKSSLDTTIKVPTPHILYDVSFEKASSANVSFDSSVDVDGNVNFNSSSGTNFFNYALNVRGDVDVQSESGGSTDIILNGSTDQLITVAGGIQVPGDQIVVQNTSGTIRQIGAINDPGLTVDLAAGSKWSLDGVGSHLTASAINASSGAKIIRNCNTVSATITGSGYILVPGKEVNLSIADAAPLAEPDSGSVPQEFIVSVSPLNCMATTFQYGTGTGTASGATDYTAITTSPGTINAAQSSMTISVNVLGDTLDELNEYYTVNISSTMMGVTISDGEGQGVINDNDAEPTISIADIPSVTEGSDALFIVSLDAPSGKNVTFNWTTGNASALSGSDYTGSSGSASILAGDNSITLPGIATSVDGSDPGEYFTVTLSSINNAQTGVVVGKAYLFEPAVNSFSLGGSITFSNVDWNQFTASISFSGDDDADASVTLHICSATDVPACDPVADGTSYTMTRSGSDYTRVVSGLIAPYDPRDVLNVAIVAVDGDGVSGSPATDSVQLNKNYIYLDTTSAIVENITENTFRVVMPVLGDDNKNASLTLHYCNDSKFPGCDPEDGNGFSVAMGRAGNEYSAFVADKSFTKLDGNELINIRVVAADADGYQGGNVWNRPAPIYLSPAPVSPIGAVNAIAKFSDGRRVVAGSFPVVDSKLNRGFAAINFDGSEIQSFVTGIGPSFAASASIGTINSIEISNDNKIYLAGNFQKYDSVSARNLVRIDAGGFVDTTFNIGAVGFNNDVTLVKPLIDGRVLVAGLFTQYQGVAVKNLVRLNSDVTIDSSFSIGATSGFSGGNINVIEVQSDNKILVGGSFTTLNGIAVNYLVRLNSDGSIDSSFILPGAFSVGEVSSLVIDGNNDIYVGGNFDTLGGVYKNGIMRLNADGSIDSGFNVGPNVSAAGFGVSGVVNKIKLVNTSLYVAGSFSFYNGLDLNDNIIRLNLDGSHDSAFAGQTDGIVWALDVLPHPTHKILIGGAFFTAANGGSNCYKLCVLDQNGFRLEAFNSDLGVRSGATDIKIITSKYINDKAMIFVSGASFDSFNAIPQGNIVILNSNGKRDLQFKTGSGFNNIVNAVTIHNIAGDERILVGGAFTSYNGVSRSYITRLMQDGQLDANYNSANYPNAAVRTIGVQSTNKIIVAGDFASGFSGGSSQYIKRLDEYGFEDPSFNSGMAGANGWIGNIFIPKTGAYLDWIYIVGNFGSYNANAAYSKMVRLYADGAPDPGFDVTTTFSSAPVKIVSDSSDNVYVVGGFTSYNGSSSLGGIAKLNSSGTLNSSFKANNGTAFGLPSMVRSLAVEDGFVYVGSAGDNSFNGLTYGPIVRLYDIGGIDISYALSSVGVITGSVYAIAPDGPSNHPLLGGFYHTLFNTVPQLNFADFIE